MGKSGEGKSSLARQVLVNVAGTPDPDPDEPGRHIWNVPFLATLEMTKTEVAMYSACCTAGVDSRRIRTKHRDENGDLVSNMTPEDWRLFHAAAAEIGKLPMYLEDDRKRTISQIRAELRQRVAELSRGVECPICGGGHRCKARLSLLVVDTLQILARNEQKSTKDEEAPEILDNVTRALGDTARDFNIAVWALSQTNASGSAYGSPGAIRAHAQTMLHVKYSKKKAAGGAHADDTSAQHDAQITIDKCRAGWEGPIPLWYRPAYTRFEE
jgi:replicative DNA helicase